MHFYPVVIGYKNIKYTRIESGFKVKIASIKHVHVLLLLCYCFMIIVIIIQDLYIWKDLLGNRYLVPFTHCREGINHPKTIKGFNIWWLSLGFGGVVICAQPKVMGSRVGRVWSEIKKKGLHIWIFLHFDVLDLYYGFWYDTWYVYVLLEDWW